MAEHTLPDNRPNERQAEGDGSTQSPLSREALLQLEHDDPARQNAIIERAIHLLPKAPRDIHDDEDLVSSNRGYACLLEPY
jgi:hypothetical protein